VPKPPRYYGSVGKKIRKKKSRKEIMTTNETR
jgi:hypothetical protein